MKQLEHQGGPFVSPVIDEDGRITQHFASFLEITDRKRLMADLLHKATFPTENSDTFSDRLPCPDASLTNFRPTDPANALRMRPSMF